MVPDWFFSFFTFGVDSNQLIPVVKVNVRPDVLDAVRVWAFARTHVIDDPVRQEGLVVDRYDIETRLLVLPGNETTVLTDAKTTGMFIRQLQDFFETPERRQLLVIVRQNRE